MDSLEQYLATYYGGSSCGLFPRASTGLYSLFVALRNDFGPGEVIIPAICCESVALAAIYAGLKPVIVDVEADTFSVSYDSVMEHVSEKTRALVLVYVFGHLFDPMPFVEFGKKAGILVIEDLAQAVGGEYRGRRAGCSADFTLLSFSDDKIIRGRGGALVQRTGYDNWRNAVETLPAARCRPVLRRKSLSQRNLSHALIDLVREDGWGMDVSHVFNEMIPHYRDLYVLDGRHLAIAGVREQIDRIEEARQGRYARYRRYRDGIASDRARVVQLEEGTMVWRTCVMAGDGADARTITDLLRRNDIPASNHYFPLDKLLYDESHEAARYVGERIVNLWVDLTVSDDQVERTIGLINDYRGAPAGDCRR